MSANDPDHHRLAHPCPGPELGGHPALRLALLDIKAAAALANARAGAIRPAEADAIVAACDRLADPAEARRFRAPLWLGGGAVAVNAEVNGRIADTAGLARDGGLVNASQSTADVCHTAGRIAVRRELVGVASALDDLAVAFRDAGRRWSATRPDVLALTCLQDALTVPTVTWPDGVTAVLRRAAGSLRHALGALDEVTIGATVVGLGHGTPPGYRREVVARLAERTGLALRPHPDAASALQHGDDLVAVGAVLAQVASRLIRVAHDLRLLASGPAGGMAALRLVPTGDGSSFFPAKTNPIDAETAVQLACRALGHHHTVVALSDQAELHLDVFDLPAAVAVLDAGADVAAAVASLHRALDATVAAPSDGAARIPGPEAVDVA